MGEIKVKRNKMITTIIAFSLSIIMLIGTTEASAGLSSTVDNSVDKSSTQVVGQLKITYSCSAEDSIICVYDSGKVKVDYLNPKNDYVEMLIDEARSKTERIAASASEPSGNKYTYQIGSTETTVSESSYDNRVYTWVPDDDGGIIFGDPDAGAIDNQNRHMVISGDYARTVVFTVVTELRATDHLWDEGKITKNATEAAAGVRTFTCTQCKRTKTEAIPKLKCPGAAFTDMPACGNWAHTPIDWAVSGGITNGTSATTFGPGDTCTRGQIVTFLWRSAGQPAPKSHTCAFTDVKSSDYYYNAILWAVENGITNGTGAATFDPNSNCTRGQIVTFLWRAKGEPKPSSSVNPFADVKSGDYCRNAVLWAVKQGITNGTGKTTFGPNESCTRAQAVAFLYRAFN